MAVASALTGPEGSAASGPERRLRGLWLALAWVGWLILTILSLTGFVASIHEYLLAARTLCRPGACVAGQPTLDTARTLAQVGLSVSGYAAVSVSLVVFAGLTYCIVAGVLIWRRPADWMVLLSTSMFITQGLYENNYLQSMFDDPASPWRWAGLLLSYLSPIQFLFFCALFPNGKAVPRWMGWLLLALCVVALPPTLFPAMPLGGLMETLFVISGFPLVAWSMMYRYRYVSNAVERQQTKWVLFGVTVILFAFMGWFLPQIVLYGSLSQPGSIYDLIGHPLYLIAALAGPICVAIAVLQYRLWDIDTLINKALVYGVLTGLLGALYIGLIVGLEGLVGALTGNITTNRSIALVISTLAIAALFQPARGGIQRAIDSRFYRRKYDAEKTLAAFSETLRYEVDLETMRARMLTLIDETLRPAHLSLWLRPVGSQRADDAHRRASPGSPPSGSSQD
ncbi:MAG TPA: hypothetical protein VFN78_06085 [Ktedonobacterales bacterium]|nr:hypothetical protein [Ktedonobacterales bacterium]